MLVGAEGCWGEQSRSGKSFGLASNIDRFWKAASTRFLCRISAAVVSISVAICRCLASLCKDFVDDKLDDVLLVTDGDDTVVIATLVVEHTELVLATVYVGNVDK